MTPLVETFLFLNSDGRDQSRRVAMVPLGALEDLVGELTASHPIEELLLALARKAFELVDGVLGQGERI